MATPVAIPVAPSAHAPAGHADPAVLDRLLAGAGFPSGLRQVMQRSLQTFPLRLWVVDNSGSMASGDGHRLVVSGSGRPVSVSCSRWEELRETVLFHGGVADAAAAPTEFRLLNPPLGGGGGGQFVFCPGGGAALEGAMRSSPSGYTPLCAHVRHCVEVVTAQAAELRSRGQKAVLVIATDGVSSDGDLSQALRVLRSLPVWVIVRLCTDEDNVVSYWNNIDDELELDMDVLDDHAGEAEECNEHNPFINYALPLHRAREWGVHSKLFDILDERAFTLSEMKDFVELLLGVSELPHPEVDWEGFEKRLVEAMKREPDLWDPVRKIKAPWISISRLRKQYGKGGGCVLS